MRRILMAAILLAAAVVLQLTTVNGLRLPGGGVPDLVLVVVAALGLASGPASGAIAGFAAGLCLDLAPPASGVIGEYALVFVLVGWACGRLHATLARSAVLPIAIVAGAAAVAEIAIAGLSLALQSAEVSWAAIRQLLPSAVSYDVAISPFVLYLVLLAGAWLAEAAQGRPAMSRAGRALAAGRAGSAAGLGHGLVGRRGLADVGALAGGSAGPVGPGSSAVLLGLGGWLAGPPEGRRARKAAARRTPRLRPGSGHPGDGWIGGSAAARSLAGSVRYRSAGPGPSFGGQALGGQAPTGAALRGQAFRGRTVAGLAGGSARPAASAARLRGGVAGSAAPGRIPRTLAARPVRVRFGGRGRGRPAGRGGWAAGPAGGAAVRAGGGTVGLGRGRGTGPRGGRGLRAWLAGGRIFGGAFSRRIFTGRQQAGRGPVRPGRSLDRSAMARLGRRRSRRRGGFRASGLPGGSTAYRPAGAGPIGPAAPVRMGPTGRGRDGVIGGGALTRPGRLRRPAAPRFRIQAGPAAGGSARRPATPRFRTRSLAGAAPMSGKRPRFSHRRWRVLSMLTSRPGSRRDVWRAHSKRPGGPG